MAAGEPSVVVEDRPKRKRYEISVDGTLAGFATYRVRPGAIVVLHSEVFPEFEQRGFATELTRAVLDDIRARGLRVVPQCPFTAKYIREHPGYDDLVSDIA